MATPAMTSAGPAATLRATPQGGILEGLNPTIYNPRYPIVTFIIQAGIIIIFCRIIHWPLSKIRQPKVIAEIIGGIILGPSVLGRIPNFTDTIFPAASIPNLNLVANLGLVLFLFLVGLELDLSRVKENWRIALTVGICDITLPFALGCAIAWGLYNEFSDEEGVSDIRFPVFMLFIGIAIAITAFPVLCRILTELQLLNTPVGVITLSSGVGNDVIAWILLALCVALVNANSGITALYILLTTAGYGLALFFIVKPIFHRYLRRSGAIQDGPSQTAITMTILIALASAFFTEVIGVHAIFGAFMAGIICPHEGGFAIKVTEKIEDLITTLFLPLFFTLSGLSTNIGLLDTGITWAYVIGVIAVAFFGKFIGGTFGARVNGLLWRESMAIGALMSCKGLVEIIVLNIGLQAEILSTRTFTIFVVMALVTTFATTPLVQLIYPQSYQRKVEAWRKGEIDWDTGLPCNSETSVSIANNASQKHAERMLRNILVYLRLDSMPGLLDLLSLLGSRQAEQAGKHHARHEAVDDENRTMINHPVPISVCGLRLIEHSDRHSADMKIWEAASYKLIDPLVQVLRAWARLFNINITCEVQTTSQDRFAETLVDLAADRRSDLLLLPWSEPVGNYSETQDSLTRVSSKNGLGDKLANDAYCALVRRTFESVNCTTAVLVGDSTRISEGQSCHIFLPYHGHGPDDIAALDLVLQLAGSSNVTATVLGLFDDSTASIEVDAFVARQAAVPPEIAPRLVFEKTALGSGDALELCVRRAETELSGLSAQSCSVLVVLGRNGRSQSPQPNPQADCLGPAAVAFAKSGLRASILVVQGPSGRSLEDSVHSLKA